MNRIVTSISIFILIISLTICETVYVSNISKQTMAKLETAIEQYENGEIENAEKSVSEADKIWEDNTECMNAFLVHDNIDEVAGGISTAKMTLEYQQARFPIECASAMDSIKIILYSMLPSWDNVL